MFEISAEREHLFDTKLIKSILCLIEQVTPSVLKFRRVMQIYIYRVSQEECTKLRESVPYVKLYGYNPKHLYPKLNGYGDNDQRSLKV